MEARFIKCRRGSLETIYTTLKSSEPEDLLRFADNEPIYLKLYTDDILNFKVSDKGIIAEVMASVGKIPATAWDYTAAHDGISDKLKPIIFISALDSDAIENFEELVKISDLHSEILRNTVKD